METETIEKKDTVTIYEVSYLLLPSLALEQVPREVASIEEAITSRGGQVISGENPVLIDLAYPMVKVVSTVRHKCDKGYFGWTKFEMPKDGISDVRTFMDGNDDVLRYLIIRTVRENTLISGKMILRKEESKKEVAPLEETPVEEPSTPEEIDKSIDDLVIV